MYHYIIFYFLEILLFVIAKGRSSKILLLICFIISVLFSGLRFETGYDYDYYYEIFTYPTQYHGFIEPGFMACVELTKALGLNFFSFVFLSSILTNTLIYKTIKNQPHPNLCYLIYLMTPGLYLQSFSLIRQFLALSIFVYSVLIYCNTKRLYLFLIFGIFSVSFHYTAIVPIIIALYIFHFRERQASKNIAILVILSSIGLSQTNLIELVISAFLDTKYSGYLDWLDPQSPVKILILNTMGIFIVLKSDVFKNDSKYCIMYNIWLSGLVIYNLFIEYAPITRLNYYFTFFHYSFFENRFNP